MNVPGVCPICKAVIALHTHEVFDAIGAPVFSGVCEKGHWTAAGFTTRPEVDGRVDLKAKVDAAFERSRARSALLDEIMLKTSRRAPGRRNRRRA